MIDDDRYCDDVLLQIASLTNALKSLGNEILRSHMKSCMVEDIKKGMVSYKTDSYGNVHTIIGKVSFDDDKLLENLNYVVNTINKVKPAVVKGKYIENISISSTMGPGVKIDKNSFDI